MVTRTRLCITLYLHSIVLLEYHTGFCVQTLSTLITAELLAVTYENSPCFHIACLYINYDPYNKQRSLFWAELVCWASWWKYSAFTARTQLHCCVIEGRRSPRNMPASHRWETNSVALLILTSSLDGVAVSTTPSRYNRKKKPRYLLYRGLCRSQCRSGWVWGKRKCLAPTGFWTQYPPARSESFPTAPLRPNLSI